MDEPDFLPLEVQSNHNFETSHVNQDIVSPLARIPCIASLIVEDASEDSIRALGVDNAPPNMSPVIASPTFESEPNVLFESNNSFGTNKNDTSIIQI